MGLKPTAAWRTNAHKKQITHTLFACMIIKVKKFLQKLASRVFLCFTHEATRTHSHTKSPVSLLQRSEWFCSQLSHITGEEGVRPSIKELFKWNHVLWWFKANISLAHSYWMCPSEERAFKWVRTLLYALSGALWGWRRGRRGAGKWCQNENGSCLHLK